MPALATSFRGAQTGDMAFSNTVIQIYLNDTQAKYYQRLGALASTLSNFQIC